MSILLVAALVTSLVVGLEVFGSGRPGGHGRGDLSAEPGAVIDATAAPVAMVPAGTGAYSVVTTDGGVYSFGGAPFYGAASQFRPAKPLTGAAPTPDGQGYWLTGTDGGIFAFGDAGFFGSMGGQHLNAPVVGMAVTPSGNGYWLVASDGGVFAFGDAPFLGSMGGQRLNSPVVGISVGAGGYRLVAGDGGIFSFGAPFFGSMGDQGMPAPVRSMATTPSGNGYWLVGGDGSIYSFGDAQYSGRTQTAAPALSTGTTPNPGPNPSPAPSAASGPLGPASGPNGPWQLVFDDEFQGSSLDTTKWSVGWLASGITPPVNGEEQECYDPAQVSVNNGLDLSLVPRTESCGGQTRPYASGLIESNGKFNFTYGYAEARITLPAAGPGTIANWPAFWTDGQNWPADGEMDIMEGLGGQAGFHFHSPAGGPGGDAPGDYTGTHVYGAEWEPGRVDYYYDGQLVGTVTDGITSAPMYLILNYATDNQYGGPQEAPADMHVDYVRVWQ